mmetsp:Transcript_23020/g.42394  ORF Transcript_23020/g.42394 Transcript_23020/m.42394 type:complete len:217 (-) Transcript_23020:39-689(-)
MLPRPSVSRLSSESWWVSAPSTTNVRISMSLCGWVPNPRTGWTKSSFITRSTPKLLGPFMYSANSKWNIDFNQFSFVQPVAASLPGFGFSSFPNRRGSGSLTKRSSLDTTAMLPPSGSLHFAPPAAAHKPLEESCIGFEVSGGIRRIGVKSFETAEGPPTRESKDGIAEVSPAGPEAPTKAVAERKHLMRSQVTVPQLAKRRDATALVLRPGITLT